MDCALFESKNMTHTNLMLHHFFPPGQLQPQEISNWWDWSASDFDNLQKIYYEDAVPDNFTDYDLIVNRTTHNVQHFNLSLGSDLDFITINKHVQYHSDAREDISLHRLANATLYAQFENSVTTTRLFETSSMMIGYDCFKPVTLHANPSRVIQKGKQVTKKLFEIPYQYSDIVLKQINVEKRDTIVDSVRVKSYAEQVGKHETYSQLTKLDIDFIEYIQNFEYYSTVDVISSIGGIGATVHILLGISSFSFILIYMYQLIQMIRRKQRHSVAVSEIQGRRQKLMKVLESKIENTDFEHEEQNGREDAKAGTRAKQKLRGSKS